MHVNMTLSILQDKGKELLDIDWSSVEFTEGVILLNKDSVIHMCMIANCDSDDCNYAICNGCKMKHENKKRRRDVLHQKRSKTCNHHIHHLVPTEMPFWCGTKYINGQKWNLRPKGCVCCRKKFVGEYTGKS